MEVQESRQYELMVIFSGDLTEADFEKELGEFRNALKENCGKLTFEESWGRRDFAFKIKRQKRGYYVVFNFDAVPPQIVEIRNNIKLNPHILRYLLIAAPENYDPLEYKKEVVFRTAEEEGKKPAKMKKSEPKANEQPAAEKAVESSGEPKPQPKVAGRKEEEELETVEQRLEKILENPDIDIK